MIATNIEIEYMVNPLGLDVKSPRVSWICKDGNYQNAYQVECRIDNENIWDSGKVESNNSNLFLSLNLRSRQQVELRIRLWSDGEQEPGEWSEKACFEMGLLEEDDWQAKWIEPEEKFDIKEHQPASYLKKTFNINDVSTARAYISAHGLYEAFLNGKRVGDYVLSPGTTNYDRRIFYQTYDVTELICKGLNEVEIILGDGWYRSCSGVDGDRNLYGERLAVIFQLEVDNKTVCISDDSWSASQNGPIRYNDMQQGEIVDSRIDKINDWHKCIEIDEDIHKLKCSNAVGIKEHEHFKGHLIETPNGDKVLDFGQNLAGYIDFTLNAASGQTIQIICGETLDENGNFTQENFQDRKRHKEGGTKQELIYTCKDGINHYHTKFSIWGFRYALIKTDIDITDASFEAIAVYSDMEERTKFSCGNNLVNKLFKNSIWSMKSNFCDIPTDCPTRERAAWTGDMGVFINTGLRLMGCESIVRKWLEDCRFAQHKDGKISNIAPRNNQPSFFAGLLAGSVGWGDACIIVPYRIYEFTGDRRILEDNYHMMKGWMEYLETRGRDKPKNPLKRFRKDELRDYKIETGIDYGEWCEPDVQATNAMRTPQGKIATAWFAHSAKMLAEIATVLGEKSDAEYYEKLADNVKRAWYEMVTDNGRIVSSRQADYVRAIAFDLLSAEEKAQAAKDLDDMVRANDYHLNTGFLSTPDLCRVLSENGYNDTAYKLLLQETMPSWLYAVKKGATSIWETWNGIDENNIPHESLNHYSYGAISGWLIDGVCGIKACGDEIIIRPHPNRLLGYANAKLKTKSGTVESGWQYIDDKIEFNIVIPNNAKATFISESGEESTIEPGCHKFTYPA